MKKFLKIIIPIIIICVICFLAFRKIEPVDDTKKFYVSCNSINSSYEIFSGTEIKFAQKDSKCKLNLKVENVDRTYLKVKSETFLMHLDGNGKIDENTVSKDIFVLPTEKLTLYSQDKSTKFEFEYK
jgi:uncharacterized protein YxeA